MLYSGSKKGIKLSFHQIQKKQTAMLKQFFTISTAFLIFLATAAAQTAVIKGRVLNAANNEAVPLATLALQNTEIAIQSDLDGNYEFVGLQPGIYTVVITFVGFKDKIVNEIQVSNNKPTLIDFALEEASVAIEKVVVKASAFRKTEESPVSLRSIGVAEIQRAPGGNRDISRAVQSLPGVTTVSSNRNDLVIRGGSPNENRFYLDDVEVPNINHFATQGASGGPVGLINVDFVREVDFFSGAFPANRGNTMSSVFNFKFKDGRDDRVGATVTLGTNDLGATIEGPLSKKTTFLASARRSNLGALFRLIGLPFLPIYNDFQFKVKTKFDTKNELTVIGLGALDEFALNKEANKTEAQRYILSYLPVLTQWNYTTGVVYKHFYQNGYITAVASRNMLNNQSLKYQNNDESSETNLNLRYKSQEIENKVRLENTQRFKSGMKLNYGAAFEYVKYNNSTYQKFGPRTIEYNSALDFNKTALFGQISQTFFEDRLTASAGLRTDAASYSSAMSNPLEQLSPRLSLAYALNSTVSLNFNTGIYYQLPAYTILGYRQNEELVNRTANTKYIRSAHVVGGLEFNLKNNAKLTVEGYFKNYDNYPIAFLPSGDTLSLANLGADYTVVGNSPAQSLGKGRTYGVEFLYQQRLFKGFYGILAYTYGRSEFTNLKGDYIVSSWDSQHIISAVASKKFENNWEIGARWRFQSGLPYTPFDEKRSAEVARWNAIGQGTLDFSKINTLRYGSTQGLDIRIDKKWFFKKWNIDFYVDVQNVYGYQIEQNLLTIDKGADGLGDPTILVGSDNIPRYRLKTLPNKSGNTTPTLGIIVEY